jgi:hypothetical protein
LVLQTFSFYNKTNHNNFTKNHQTIFQKPLPNTNPHLIPLNNLPPTIRTDVKCDTPRDDTPQKPLATKTTNNTPDTMIPNNTPATTIPNNIRGTIPGDRIKTTGALDRTAGEAEAEAETDTKGTMNPKKWGRLLNQINKYKETTSRFLEDILSWSQKSMNMGSIR